MVKYNELIDEIETIEKDMSSIESYVNRYVKHKKYIKDRLHLMDNSIAKIRKLIPLMVDEEIELEKDCNQ